MFGGRSQGEKRLPLFFFATFEICRAGDVARTTARQLLGVTSATYCRNKFLCEHYVVVPEPRPTKNGLLARSRLFHNPSQDRKAFHQLSSSWTAPSESGF
jgi:hypothetical protein